MTAPPGYAEIELALRHLERGDDDLALAHWLDGIGHPGAQKAARLLRQGRRAGAEAVLEEALETLAGPASGSAMSWFTGWGPSRAESEGCR